MSVLRQRGKMKYIRWARLAQIKPEASGKELFAFAIAACGELLMAEKPPQTPYSKLRTPQGVFENLLNRAGYAGPLGDPLNVEALDVHEVFYISMWLNPMSEVFKEFQSAAQAAGYNKFMVGSTLCFQHENNPYLGLTGRTENPDGFKLYIAGVAQDGEYYLVPQELIDWEKLAQHRPHQHPSHLLFASISLSPLRSSLCSLRDFCCTPHHPLVF